MPTDFDPIMKQLSTEDSIRQAHGGSGTYIYNRNDAIKSAIEVVKAIFPDYTQKISPKISIDPTDNYNATGEYSPLSNSIKLNPRWMAGQVVPSSSQTIGVKGKKDSYNINFTTEEVMDNVFTILHELYHARSGGGWSAQGRSNSQKQSGVTDDMLTQINQELGKKEQFNGGLPSMKESYLDTEEFLASAVPLMDMNQEHIIPEKGQLANKLKTVKDIITKYPQMGTFIDSQRFPDIPSLKSGAPEPGTLGALIESVFGPQN